MFNTVLLCFQHYGWTYKYDGSREYSDGVIVIYYLNAACTFFFVFEALIKLVVLTPPIYFRNLWNTFSFLIVLGSVIEFIVQRSGMTGVPYSHIASTFRVLRLLQFIPRVKRILWTIIRSLKVCCFLSLPSPFPPPSLPPSLSISFIVITGLWHCLCCRSSRGLATFS